MKAGPPLYSVSVSNNAQSRIQTELNRCSVRPSFRLLLYLAAGPGKPAVWRDLLDVY